MSAAIFDPNADYQPKSFAFTSESAEKARSVIARYPSGRQQSAVMPLLAIAQEQNDNWLPKAAMDEVAQMLSMPPMRVYEVASFYTMYNLVPMGRHHVQLCTTTPCWLRGSDAILDACQKKLGVHAGETTADGAFTFSEVECLGACVNAPMMQITSAAQNGKPYTDVFFEDITPEIAVGILDELAAGRTPKTGPQTGRQTSCPANGSTTLKHA